jgi:serine/threonine protein kinase
MGEVHRARDEKLGRDVAIKLLPASSFSDAAARARLVQEARAAAALNHSHICTIHEVGEARGQAYIVMELIEGVPLNSRLTAGPLAPAEVGRYGLQLADALAHERGVIHRDLKSGNVMITPDGRVKMLDFGLAKRFSSEEMSDVTTEMQLTNPGALVGTLAYLAPEQLRGLPADARSDIWALGVVLYEMSTGERPFQGHTGFELSAAILNQPPAPLTRQLPQELAECASRSPTKTQDDPSTGGPAAGEPVA